MPIFKFCPSSNATKPLLTAGFVGFVIGITAGPCVGAGAHAFSTDQAFVSHFPAPPPSSSASPEEPSEPEPEQTVDPTRKALVHALHRREQYRSAREIIRARLKSASGRVETYWLNRLGENFRMDGMDRKAASAWGRLIETRSAGPLADWKLHRARALLNAGLTSEAEVLLLRIRYEHPRSAPWLDAMLELAQISLDRSRPREARQLLSIASQRFPPQNHPRLAYDLARIYDRFPSIRNFSRAVRLYEMAASRFPSRREEARRARSRAAHLTRAYLEFGVE